MPDLPKILDDNDIAYMRDMFESSMTQRCNINRPSRVIVKGNYSRTVDEVATNVRCRLMPGYRQPRERGDDGGTFISSEYDVEHVLTVMHDVDVQRGDHIDIVGGRNKYVVSWIRLDDAQWKTCLRVGLKIAVTS